MPALVREPHPPGAPAYKTEDEVEEPKWTNYGHAIYRRILELDDHDFQLQTEKQFEDANDFEHGVFTDIGNKIQKTRLSLRNNVFLGTGTHGKPRPVGGAGVAKVISNPSFPEHSFLKAGRLFRVMLRHNNLSFEDDATLDGRVTCIRMMDENKAGSYVDFILHTGTVAQFYNAQSFEEFLEAFKEGKNGLREWLLKKPAHLYGRIENVRRDPKSFYDMRYHSHVTYNYESTDGKSRLARFRLIPALDVDETGQLNADEQESVWDYDRLASDPREADYLRVEYRKRLSHSALQYILQMQVLDVDEVIEKNASDSFVNHDDIYNPCMAWDYKTNPWHDVTIITVTTPLVEDHLAHVDFSLGNHVASLRPMEAESLREFNSLSLAMKNFHGVPSKADERELGFYGTNTKKTGFKINVTTGNFAGAGTDADVTITLTGGLGRTGVMSLDRRFQDVFEPGKTDEFNLSGPFISDVQIIELEMKTVMNRAWYVDHISVMDQTTRRTSNFPVHRWITTMEPLAIVRRAEAIPPHLETLPTLYLLRKQEIQERRKLYQWQDVPGLPSHARFDKYDHLPKEAKFLKEKEVNLMEKYLKNLSNTGSGSVRSIFETWDVFSDCPKLLKDILIDKTIMTHVVDHWTSDHEFGRQFLNGPHPVKIECLTSLPANFEVTNEMVKDFLEDDLEEVIEEGYMYMVSYPELQYLENGTSYKGKYKRYFAAPMCLLYAKESGSLVPIAIQLNQGNPKKMEEQQQKLQQQQQQVAASASITNGDHTANGDGNLTENEVMTPKAIEETVEVTQHVIEMSIEENVMTEREATRTEDGLNEQSLEKLGAEMNELDQRKPSDTIIENGPVFAEDVQTSAHEEQEAKEKQEAQQKQDAQEEQGEQEEQESRIWTPRDASMWDYIKMWVKQADAQVHQVVSRHLKTNLVMEVFAVATLRNLPSVHPVSKMLTPHIRNTIAVNTLGRQSLYHEDGLFQKYLAVGGQHEELMREAFKSFSIHELNFPKELERRGVTDEEKLPRYFYRDDGMKLWKVIHKFVRTMLKLQYWTDGNVQADEEIQAWIQDIHLHGFPAGEDGFDHDVPSSFYTLMDLVEFVTIIIFTASCQTSALTAGMMDHYGVVPNYPTIMLDRPPTYLSHLHQDDIKKSLPARGKAAEVIAACHTLSRMGRDCVYLGDYPAVYIDDKPMQAAIIAFQEDLRYIAEAIDERNTEAKSNYPYLHPGKIPSSISM